MNDEKREWVEDLITLYQMQLSYGAEIVELTSVFFQEEISLDDAAQKVLEEEQAIEDLQVFTDHLIHLDEFTSENIKEQLKATQQETGYRGRRLFMPISVATTRHTNGPELPNANELIARDDVLHWIDQILNELGA